MIIVVPDKAHSILIQEFGIQIVVILACGTTGIGRMAEPADILTTLIEVL